MKNLNYLKLSMVVIPLLLITACGDDPENEGNHLPTVKITSENKVVNQGETVNLSATAMDVDGDSLTYLWKIKSKPNGSEAQLSNSRTKRVSLLTDERGDYVLSFVANDGLTDSKIATATVHANSNESVTPNENDGKDESKNHDVISNKTGILGAWTIDVPKADAIINSYEEDDPTALFVGLIIMSMKDIEFKENGTCAMPGMNAESKSKKCWEANDNGYLFYGDNDEPSATIEINDNILKIKFEESENSKAIDLEYTRVDEATLVPPSVVMKKDRVYHARDIKHKEFNDVSDAFLIFTEEDKYFWMVTKDSASFTANELKEIMNEDDMSKRSELIGSNYTAFRGDSYHVKNNTFYTVMGGKKIEVVTSSHIKYDGYDYYLE